MAGIQEDQPGLRVLLPRVLRQREEGSQVSICHYCLEAVCCRRQPVEWFGLATCWEFSPAPGLRCAGCGRRITGRRLLLGFVLGKHPLCNGCSGLLFMDDDRDYESLCATDPGHDCISNLILEAYGDDICFA